MITQIQADKLRCLIQKKVEAEINAQKSSITRNEVSEDLRLYV